MKRNSRKQKNLKVVELFAGVGGFRIGLERASKKGYETVWFNQWEPQKSDGSQHAWQVYCRHFKEDALLCRDRKTNWDIAKVDAGHIPDHDLLVGGFPCQDYSVARTLSQAAGLVGKKGVLWWEIYRILKKKKDKAPRFLMLENVDRLLKSPVAARGKDFAIMLASLDELGYAVEWRVINAADYGMPQRRRRVYILGYRKGTPMHEAMKAEPIHWLLRDGIMPVAFPIRRAKDVSIPIRTKELRRPEEISASFTEERKASPFENSGVMVDGMAYTATVEPEYRGKRMMLKHILLPESRIPEEYFIPSSQLAAWKRLKGGKKEKRRSKDGFEYDYSEGPVAFPDHLDRPSRTIVTGEGGSTPSRFKHVVMTRSGRLRRLVPEELERLNMFPPGITEGVSPAKRAFFMGNALVVGIVEKLGRELFKRQSD